MPRRGNKTGFTGTPRNARAAVGPKRLSVADRESASYTLPKDNRQLAKNEPLDSVKLSRIALALCPDYTATYPPTSGEGGAAAPETPGLHFPNEDPNQGFGTEFRAPGAQEFKRGWLG